MRFGGYAPQNLDRSFARADHARAALQASRNLPAVALLEVGRPGAAHGPAAPRRRQPAAAARRRARPRHRPRRRRPDPRGPRPPLCRDRRRRAAVPLSPRPRRRRAPRSPACSMPSAAWYVADILARHAAARRTASPGSIAYKTGTSYGHRDAWAIGFDGAHVIGVWFGRPDGASVPGALGLDAAAPLLFDAFARLSPDARAAAAAAGLRADSRGVAELPAPLRRFHARGAPMSAVARRSPSRPTARGSISASAAVLADPSPCGSEPARRLSAGSSTARRFRSIRSRARRNGVRMASGSSISP